MIMCSACIPVMAKYRKKKTCVFCAMSGAQRLLAGLASLRIDRRIHELRDVEAGARNVVLLPLLLVLNILDAKEGAAEDRGQDQASTTSTSFLRTSAAHTPSAMKKPEVIRIAVLAAPSGMLSWFDAATNAS